MRFEFETQSIAPESYYHFRRLDNGLWWDAAAGGWVRQHGKPAKPSVVEPSSFGCEIRAVPVSEIPPGCPVRCYTFADEQAQVLVELDTIYPCVGRFLVAANSA